VTSRIKRFNRTVAQRASQVPKPKKTSRALVDPHRQARAKGRDVRSPAAGRAVAPTAAAPALRPWGAGAQFTTAVGGR
jgi:hypothetical protein